MCNISESCYQGDHERGRDSPRQIYNILLRCLIFYCLAVVDLFCFLEENKYLELDAK